jgi:periplasmic divalent cation tolerance protein
VADIPGTPVAHVTFSVDDDAAAEAIVGELFERRLVACAKRLGQVRSTYRWEGALEESVEWVVELTTTVAAADEVVSCVVGRHPYVVPEVVVTPVTSGHGPYVAWVTACVDPD